MKKMKNIMTDGMKYLQMETIKNGSICLKFIFFNKVKMESVLRTMLNEFVKVMNAEKVTEIYNEVMKANTTVAPKEEKKKADDDKKAKRIGRMTMAIANQLKAELVKSGMKFPEDDKKEFDKIKKEFVSYVDDLTEEDFSAKNLADHMRDFANHKKPAEEKEAPPKKEAAKKKESAKKAEKKTEEVSNAAGGSAPEIRSLSLGELQKIEKIVTPGDGTKPVGVYWDGDNSGFVTGPEKDDQEEYDEKRFEGKTYEVGDRTGRVYEPVDDDGESFNGKFVGFIGVGRFKGMK